MTSRYPNPRLNRGRVASGPAAPNAGAAGPLSIVASAANVFYLIADLGITIGTGVVAWANQGPTGVNGDLSQATGPLQPALSAAALSGKNTVVFDGADDFMTFAALDLPDPDITPTWFWIVFRQITWTIADAVFGAGGTTNMRLFQGSSVSGNMRISNGISGAENTGAPIGSFVRAEALFGNTATDYLKLGSSLGAAAAAGGNNPVLGQFVLGAYTIAGVGAANIELAAIGAWNAKPTGPELAALDAWVTGYYGAGVAV